MIRRRVLILNIEEVREALKAYCIDILSDTATDIIERGNCILPECVFKGIDKCTCEELIEIANCGWTEMYIELHNIQNPKDTVVAILMFVPDHKYGPTSGTTYMLSPETVFEEDFNK